MLLCTWLFTVHVHCIDWTNNLVYENKSEDRTINMFNKCFIPKNTHNVSKILAFNNL